MVCMSSFTSAIGVSAMSEAPTVFVCAPQGAGKTLHAEAIAKMFGCTSIVDEWTPGDEVPAGALVLTCVTPDDVLRGRMVPEAGTA